MRRERSLPPRNLVEVIHQQRVKNSSTVVKRPSPFLPPSQLQTCSFLELSPEAPFTGKGPPLNLFAQLEWFLVFTLSDCNLTHDISREAL